MKSMVAAAVAGPGASPLTLDLNDNLTKESEFIQNNNRKRRPLSRRACDLSESCLTQTGKSNPGTRRGLGVLTLKRIGKGERGLQQVIEMYGTWGNMVNAPSIQAA